MGFGTNRIGVLDLGLRLWLIPPRLWKISYFFEPFLKKDDEKINKVGLTMILDYNEDRQILTSTTNSGRENVNSLTEMPNNKVSASIYIDTTG